MASFVTKIFKEFVLGCRRLAHSPWAS